MCFLWSIFIFVQPSLPPSGPAAAACCGDYRDGDGGKERKRGRTEERQGERKGVVEREREREQGQADGKRESD